MCGLVGIAGANCPDRVARGLDLIRHRGPDDSGVWAEDRVTLGHCRLAIIDPQGGRQPFVSPCGRWVLVFNGEIYNYRELAARLESLGYQLATRSDTEVLLYWGAHFGIDGLKDLNGMFAFALWDGHDGKLLLSRDRLGIKPLYIAKTKSGMVFASEVKAMLPVLGSIRPNEQAISQYLTFQNVLDRQSFFGGVEKLEPGSWMEWTTKAQRSGCYWKMAVSEKFQGTAHDAVEAFRSCTVSAVRRQMVSDFPVGSYLSGGIDSATVATLAAEHSDHPLHTYTGAFSEAPYYDERDGARAVARGIGASLHEAVITPTDFVDHFAKVMWHLDEPTLGCGAVPQYMVSGMASQHTRVVLTGHGGDELFAGYQVNKVALLRQTAAEAPWRLPAILARLRPDELSRIAYFLLFPLVQPEVRHGLFIMTPRRLRGRILTKDFLSSLDGYEPLDVVGRLLSEADIPSWHALTFLYLRTYLHTLLIQEDKVGMAHSIEARLPLCDNDLLSLSLSLPLSAKLFDGSLKAIPRAAMRSRLPEILYGLPKRGFPVPLAAWMRRSPVREFIADLLLSQRSRQRGILRTEFVERQLAALDKSRSDGLADYARANTLYAWASIEQWHRLFVDGDGPASMVTRRGE